MVFNPLHPDGFCLKNITFSVMYGHTCVLLLLNIYYFSAACVDYDPACSGYIGISGYCDGPAIGYSHDYLMKMCKKSCGLCKT